MISRFSCAALSRRHFLSLVGGATTVARAGFFETSTAYAAVDPILAGRPLVRYPEKKPRKSGTEAPLTNAQSSQLDVLQQYDWEVVFPRKHRHSRCL
jgi:hypothetical protein